MENNNENKGFQYTYSAREQAELKRIREKYTPSTEAEDKMERLRRLDASVTQKAQTIALIFGIIGALTYKKKENESNRRKCSASCCN